MADEASRTVALGAAALACALAVALVLAVAVSHGGRARPVVAAVVEEPAVREVEVLGFASGSAALPPQANEVIGRVAQAAREEPGRQVFVSTWLAPQPDAASAAASRGQAVQHALEAHGVARRQVRLDPPQPWPAASAPALAWQVELRVR
jgi:hypothetical protein